MATVTAAPKARSRSRPAGSFSGWRGVVAAGCALGLAIAGAIIASARAPLWGAAALGAVMAAALVVLRLRPGRAGAVLAVFGAGVFLLPSALRFLDAFAWAVDPLEFTVAAAAVVAVALIGFGALVVVIRGQAAADPYERASPRGMVIMGLFLVAAALITSLALRMTVTAPAPVGADVVVPAAGFRYPETIQAQAGKAGGISLLVRNADRGAHTFTIPQLGVDVVVPGNASARVVAKAAPGSYQVRCRIPRHDGMSSVLRVQE